MKIYHPLQLNNLCSEPSRQDFIVAINAAYIFRFTYQDGLLVTDDMYLLHKHKLSEISDKCSYRYWFIKDNNNITIPLLTYSFLVLKIKNKDTGVEYESRIDLRDRVNTHNTIEEAFTNIKIHLPDDAFVGNWIYWFYGITESFSIYDVIYFEKEIVVSDTQTYILPEQAKFKNLFFYGSLLIRN